MRIGANAMTDRCCCMRHGNWFLFSQPGTVAGTVQTRNAGGKVSLFARNTTRSACGGSKVKQGAYKVTHPSMSFLRGRVRVPPGFPTDLTLFDCSQRLVIGFLGFRQPLDMRDVHALIWSFPYQCLEAVVGLLFPEFDCSTSTATAKGIPVASEK